MQHTVTAHQHGPPTVNGIGLERTRAGRPQTVAGLTVLNRTNHLTRVGSSGGNTGRVPKPYGLSLPLEPGVSGLDLAAALVGWLQRECGAVAGEYEVQGDVVSIPLQVAARRVTSAGTRLHARLARAHSEELLITTEELLRRFEARHRRIRALLVEARELRASRVR